MPIQYVVDGLTGPGFVRFTGANVNGVALATTTTGQFVNLEPGSFFTTVEALDDRMALVSKPFVLHFERVPAATEIYRELRLPKQVLWALPAAVARRRVERKLCFVVRSRSLDGQKRIWLQLIASLREHPTIAYSFHAYVLYKPTKIPEPFTKMGISVTNVMLNVSSEDWATHELTVNKTKKQFAAFIEATDRSLFPTYLHDAWDGYLEAFAPCRGAILLFANARDHDDQVLALLGRHVGAAATIFELSSLFPMAFAVDAVIGPSHYAVNHSSVNRIQATRRYVIPPGVDIDLFYKRTTLNEEGRCLVVGYLGRIVAEKSLGLLASAIELLTTTANSTTSAMPCMDFRWVGDGADIDYYRRYPITLLGGIYNETDLVRELQSWDIAVHPGLQETFCIANVEVMAVGLPLVTFGVAGTTEYVRHDVNAWVVDEMSPAALADGIRRLAQDGALRRRLGDGARATVVKQFQWSDTVAKYDEVFGRLIGSMNV
ncbi:hypothetical protein ACHHYP_11166 [Achlya hypogyna]|uniref:Uncharacterized protein n=1 Tax=Achlya hypogyna TaxID=1202772 RepID=A0A1V9YJP1_ACHHY|nr:hypothetical protein ACHHYP_11166 [Achlya hypogyna]